MKQSEVIHKMSYHRKRYEYYKGLLLDGKYTTTTDTRQVEQEVLIQVAEKYGIHVDEIKSGLRYLPLPQARSDIVKIFRDKLGLTYSRIADILGMKEHTAIIYLYKKNYDSRTNSKKISGTGD